jgi:hypothetical protein
VKPMTIIARKPRRVSNEGEGGEYEEYIVVDRGEGVDMRYVSATANPHSLANGEWFWGWYFATQAEAMDHFNKREQS